MRMVSVLTKARRAPPRGSRRGADGFALLELLIVVAILLILTSIALPNLLRAREKARSAVCDSAMARIHGELSNRLFQSQDNGVSSPASAAVTQTLAHLDPSIFRNPRDRTRPAYALAPSASFIPTPAQSCTVFMRATGTTANPAVLMLQREGTFRTMRVTLG